MAPQAPGALLRTHLDGSPQQWDEREWSLRSAEFLGCGFRVVVPACGGAAALDFVRRQVEELASLLGARFDAVPWAEAAEHVAAGGDLVVEGGWESVFRAPLGPPATRVHLLPATARPAPDALVVHRAVALPWAVTAGSDLSRLPLHTTHEAIVARRRLDALHPGEQAQGWWACSDGTVVSSTCGSLLVRDGAGRWCHPEPGRGVVPTWAAHTVAAALGSRPSRLRPEDLGAPGTLVVALDAWGLVRGLACTGTGTGTTTGPRSLPVPADLLSALVGVRA